eukprot:2743272-Pleurochrysis_carterae.AAC.2
MRNELRFATDSKATLLWNIYDGLEVQMHELLRHTTGTMSKVAVVVNNTFNGFCGTTARKVLLIHISNMRSTCKTPVNHSVKGGATVQFNAKVDTGTIATNSR